MSISKFPLSFFNAYFEECLDLENLLKLQNLKREKFVQAL